MTAKRKPGKNQQFTISAENKGFKVDTPKVKPKGKIKEFDEAGLKAFNERRAEKQSIWSRIDEQTIKNQCSTEEYWDEIDDN